MFEKDSNGDCSRLHEKTLKNYSYYYMHYFIHTKLAVIYTIFPYTPHVTHSFYTFVLHTAILAFLQEFFLRNAMVGLSLRFQEHVAKVAFLEEAAAFVQKNF